MEETIPPTRRRGFLRGTLVFLGSALGLKAAGSEPVVPSPEAPGTPLRFYVRSRSLNIAPPGLGGSSTDRRNKRGALMARPDGEQVGEYYGTCLTQPGAFGMHVSDSPGVELQTFRLQNGTLFGAGADERDEDGGTMHAVLGGTGRYAGARGVLKMTPVSRENGTEDWVQVEVNLFS